VIEMSEPSSEFDSVLEQFHALDTDVTQMVKRLVELLDGKSKGLDVADYRKIAEEMISITSQLDEKRKLRDQIREQVQKNLSPFRDAREKLYQELDEIFCLRCMICDEHDIPVYLLMPCTKTTFAKPVGSCSRALHICSTCAHQMRSHHELTCPICRKTYRNRIGSCEFSFHVDIRMIDCVDRYVELWYTRHEFGKYRCIPEFGEIFECSLKGEPTKWFSSMREMLEYRTNVENVKRSIDRK
jgi:hypothetical protein